MKLCPVELQNDVADLDSGFVCRTFGIDILHEYAFFRIELECRRQRLRDGASEDAQLPAMHVSIFLERSVHVPYNVARNPEAESLAAGGLGKNQCVDSNQP